MKTDVVLVGAGPAGIFTAIEMLRKGSKKKIVVVEKSMKVRRDEKGYVMMGVKEFLLDKNSLDA